eukprot:TRINITY_DN5605_c0_g1_i1.p1 TRINITY_DN5605_c0_g1~~TRINITY_DN5605_c0_g1_i1.p1  ORF type:complete len:358 (-),score=36.30 TRINITY_DN5605_c0_g1_i1:29-1102(-)
MAQELWRQFENPEEAPKNKPHWVVNTTEPPVWRCPGSTELPSNIDFSTLVGICKRKPETVLKDRHYVVATLNMMFASFVTVLFWTSLLITNILMDVLYPIELLPTFFGYLLLAVGMYATSRNTRGKGRVSALVVTSVFIIISLLHYKVVSTLKSPIILGYLLFQDFLESFIAKNFFPEVYHQQVPSWFVQTAVYFSARSLSLWMMVLRTHMVSFPFSAETTANFCGNTFLLAMLVIVVCFFHKAFSAYRIQILNAASLLFLPTGLIVFLNWAQHIFFFWSLPNASGSFEEWTVTFGTSSVLITFLHVKAVITGVFKSGLSFPPFISLVLYAALQILLVSCILQNYPAKVALELSPEL